MTGGFQLLTSQSVRFFKTRCKWCSGDKGQKQSMDLKKKINGKKKSNGDSSSVLFTDGNSS